MRRSRAASIFAVTAVAGAIVLAGCSQQDGLGLARQACQHVEHSIRLFQASERSANATDANRLAAKAHKQLFEALPIAARANSADGQWNALMTTISESGQVDEGHLIVALKAQCKLANSSQPFQGPPPAATGRPNNSTVRTEPGNGTVPTTSPPNRSTTTAPTAQGP